ncbi:hypothetical protein P3X46_025565 [Hevea brasiliensis]|uniref:Uncharacterized protein n=1 Tax=Hevea brasiliensis TaxID=3981 RepID=A0ABQ9L5Y5_HEVBR|nr:hypothetical protein P3X46_025565 [Hevea brasiliensis]
MQIVNACNKTLQQKLDFQRNEFEQKIKELEKQVAQHDLEQKNLILQREELTDDLRKELAEKVEELQCMDNLNQMLIVKERTSNFELQEARKELLSVRILTTPLPSLVLLS